MTGKKPDRRKLTIIISAAVLLVLGAGIAALTLIPSAPQPEVSPSPSPTALATLVNEKAEAVSSVRLSPVGGKAYTITRASDGTLSITDPKLVYGTDSIRTENVFDLAICLDYLTTVKLGASSSELSGFGFDKPVVSWRIERGDGTYADFQLGYENPLSTGYYARKTDSNDVYLVGMTVSAYLLSALEDYYKITFLPGDITPSTDDNPTWSSITSVTLEKDGSVVELARRTDEELAQAGLGATYYHVVRPDTAETNESGVSYFYLTPMTTIAPTEIVDTAPADLSVYGLDKPARLSLSTEDWSGTLLIGSQNEDKTGRYVMQEGFGIVLLDTTGDYSFLTVPYYRIRSSTIWIYHIDSVQEVVFDLGAQKRVLSLWVDGEDNNHGTFDGKELSSENAKRLYRAAISLTIGGERTDSDKPGALEGTITIKMTDGATHKIELYYLNDRQLSYTVDGRDEGMYILRSTLTSEILNKFKIVDDGGELPL